MNNLYGVIDIGTLKVKSLIASISRSGELKKVYSSRTLTCFGCEMDVNDGYAKDEYIARTISELKRVKNEMKKRGVTKLRVVSTHAFRRAKNKKEIIIRIKRETGLDVENITQKEEAELFFQAALHTFPLGKEYAVVDVGGGSVQVLLGSRGNLKASYLMPTGTVSLHDAFTKSPHLKTSYTREKDIERMRNRIMNELIGFQYRPSVPIIYGSSMVIDVMKILKLPLKPHEDSRMHPYQIYKEHLSNYITTILPLTYEEREAKYKDLQEGYMWGIDKGFLNIVTIADWLRSDTVIPTNANVAEGIAYSMINS